MMRACDSTWGKGRRPRPRTHSRSTLAERGKAGTGQGPQQDESIGRRVRDPGLVATMTGLPIEGPETLKWRTGLIYAPSGSSGLPCRNFFRDLMLDWAGRLT